MLNACATVNLKNNDTANLNQKQQEAISQEIINIILQSYGVKDNQNIGLVTDTEISQRVDKLLRKSGYAVDKPNSKNLTIIYTLNRIDENTLFLNLTVQHTRLSKVYQIKPNSLMSMSPLTIGSK